MSESDNDKETRGPSLVTSLTRSARRPLGTALPTQPMDIEVFENRDQLKEWTEGALKALPPHEHDYQEFKGSGWLMKSPSEVRAEFLFYLSKQVSAFANGSGGRVFVGIDDEGHIDGGVPVDLRGGGTRAWLEDLVAGCVDPKIPQFNVYEVISSGKTSSIKPGHAVYVLDLPSSTEAPHQAKDHRYYLRIAGKSRPMGHVHVQDILRRTFHPRIRVVRFGPYGELDVVDSPAGQRFVFLRFRTFLANYGRTLARHVGLEVSLPRPFAGRDVRQRMKRLGETHHTQTPGELKFFRYHPAPLFPSQEVYAATQWLCIHADNVALLHSDAYIDLTDYADDAQPTTTRRRLFDYSVVQNAVSLIEAHSNGADSDLDVSERD